MTSDDRLFAMVQRISAIESQLITRRSFLGATDPVGARSYRETAGVAAGVGRGVGLWYPVSRVCRALMPRPVPPGACDMFTLACHGDERVGTCVLGVLARVRHSHEPRGGYDRGYGPLAACLRPALDKSERPVH